MERGGLIRICVYCGSTTGHNPIYADAARLLGEALAVAGLGLVYGGGKSGLMGILATTVRGKGGHVIGIMPSSLVTVENAFYEASEYIEVGNFHERKLLMSKMADAFIVLPGGPGTLEELIEQLAWSTLCIHDKPVFIVNTNGFWSPLIALFGRLHNRPAGADHKPGFIVVDEPDQAVKLALGLLKSNNN